MVWAEAVPAGAGSVQAHAAKKLRDWFADGIVWETGELLSGLVIEHSLVKLLLRFGSAKLGAASSLAQCFDGFAGEGLVAN